MNSDRRKRISICHALMGKIKAELDNLYEEENEAYENLPESLQQGDRGEEMATAAENLDYAKSSAEETEEYLEEYTAGDVKTDDLVNFVKWN